MVGAQETSPREPCLVLTLRNAPIYEQLLLEEYLLKHHPGNWFIWNEAPPPAIVLGISSALHELVDEAAWLAHPIPIIRRFSGGGTVVLDENTLLATWICNHSALPTLSPYPGSICEWVGQLMAPLGLQKIEQDFCLGERKVGGNAQYCRPSRWLHHTSFLWDYNPALMNLLKAPLKQPAYRQQRPHLDFCGRLMEHLPHPALLQETILNQLSTWFDLIPTTLRDLPSPLLLTPLGSGERSFPAEFEAEPHKGPSAGAEPLKRISVGSSAVRMERWAQNSMETVRCFSSTKS